MSILLHVYVWIIMLGLVYKYFYILFKRMIELREFFDFGQTSFLSVL